MKKCFVVYNNNDEIRKISSSGGVFFSLAERMLKEGGVIFAPVFDNNFVLKHTLIENINDLQKALGSKYVQSDISQIYNEVKNRLDKDEKVLFSGTPCQIIGLKKFLDKDNKNLFCVDVTCHGVASNKYWEKYKSFLEEKYGSKIISVEFRNKDYGWVDFCIKICFENRQIYKVHHDLEPFFLLFRDNYILKDSCYNCVCKGDNSLADITLADAWGTERFKDRQYFGLSYVICRSNKGRDYLIQDKSLVYEEADFDHIIRNQPFYYKSANHDNRIEYNEEDSWSEICKKYNYADLINQEKIPKEKTIIPWGAGNKFKLLVPELIRRFGINVVCDSNPDFWRKEIYPGIVCISPKEAIGRSDVLFLICIESEEIQSEIMNYLKDNRIDNYKTFQELIK